MRKKKMRRGDRGGEHKEKGRKETDQEKEALSWVEKSTLISMNQQKVSEDLGDFGSTNCWKEGDNHTNTQPNKHCSHNETSAEITRTQCVRSLTVCVCMCVFV